MAMQPVSSKPKVNTVSLKHLAASLAGDHEMPKKQAEAILGDLVNLDRKSTRLNSSHIQKSRMPSSA